MPQRTRAWQLSRGRRTPGGPEGRSAHSAAYFTAPDSVRRDGQHRYADQLTRDPHGSAADEEGTAQVTESTSTGGSGLARLATIGISAANARILRAARDHVPEGATLHVRSLERGRFRGQFAMGNCPRAPPLSPSSSTGPERRGRKVPHALRSHRCHREAWPAGRRLLRRFRPMRRASPPSRAPLRCSARWPAAWHNCRCPCLHRSTTKVSFRLVQHW